MGRNLDANPLLHEPRSDSISHCYIGELLYLYYAQYTNNMVLIGTPTCFHDYPRVPTHRFLGQLGNCSVVVCS